MAATTQVTLRKIGKLGPKIPSVGFGLMGISIGYGTTDSDEERFKVLDRAWELGCTNWDTADIYGDSEDLIGKWFKLHPERRADIFLATKFGLVFKDGAIARDASPEYAREAITKSLQRLGVDYIDLYYMHRTDDITPIEKTVEAMKQFVDEGKVKYLGLSEISSKTLRRAYAIHPITAVQIEYNPWCLEPEGPESGHLIDTTKELGVAVFAYSPLGRGLMTGRYRSIDDFDADDARRHYERFQGNNFKKNLVVVDKFTELAERKGCTSSQLVLAWLLAQDEHVFVIPGTKKIKYLEQNFAASEVTLSKEEEQQLRKLVAEAGVEGSRGDAYGDYYSDTPPLGA
ncbi:hypothetical protein G7046_g7418 [Stylonectria norvegica]|nr:hypothetical protein G7046_g7418 [Stylonectria norvegica]